VIPRTKSNEVETSSADMTLGACGETLWQHGVGFTPGIVVAHLPIPRFYQRAPSRWDESTNERPRPTQPHYDSPRR
jgi:hypothetical protein